MEAMEGSFARDAVEAFKEWLAENPKDHAWSSFEDSLFEWLCDTGYEEVGGSYETVLQVVILCLTDYASSAGDTYTYPIKGLPRETKLPAPSAAPDPWHVLFDRGNLGYARVRAEQRWRSSPSGWCTSDWLLTVLAST
jgi:hypothetical protein